MANKWIQLMSADGTDNLFPVGKMDLLWTNTAPTSSFAAQTISLDLSSYKMVYIEARWASDDAGTVSAIVRVGYGGYLFAFYNAKQSRRFDATTSGVEFKACVYGSTATTTMATDNSHSIPLRIYGIK